MVFNLHANLLYSQNKSQENAHNLAEPLHHLYNLCIRYQIFPEVFKLSKVVPIPKSKVITQCNMLRPISVTPMLARVFKGLVYDQFVSNSYNLWLNKNQFGFRNKSSVSGTNLRLVVRLLK